MTQEDTTQPPAKPSAPKVLIADDEPDALTITSFYLQRAGFKVLVASTIAETLDIASTQQPDVVILDRVMPEGDGLEVCRKLRMINPDLYILIATGMASESDREEGWQAGADDYQIKPLNLKEMVYRINALLRHKQRNGNKAENGLMLPDPVKVVPAQTENQAELDLSPEVRRVQTLVLKASRAAQADPYDLSRARDLYMQVLDLDPLNAVALKWLAYHTNDPYEGCSYLERLLMVQPDNAKARRLLEAGRKRCQEIDQQSFSKILSEVQVPRIQHTTSELEIGTVSINGNGSTSRPPLLGQVLIDEGYITKENLDTATSLQELFKQSGSARRLGEILVEYGLVSEEQLERSLIKQRHMSH